MTSTPRAHPAGNFSAGGELPQIAPLDGIRGIAALMVIVFHGWQVGAFDGPGLRLLALVAKFGQTGVDLFFVLSGFLITRILLASRTSPHYFRNFYARRSLRIFPLYYFFLFVWIFGVPLLQNHPLAPFRQTWWWWCYLQNIPSTWAHAGTAIAGPGHYWSLAVEEHFYLVWPLIVLLVPRRRLIWVSGLLIVLAILVRYVFIYKLGLPVFFFTLCRVDALAWGTLLACLETNLSIIRFRKLFLVTFIALIPLLVVVWTRFTEQGAGWLQVVKYTFVGAIYWAFLGLVICDRNARWIRFGLANKPLRFCGKVSYGLYVYQGLTLWLAEPWLSSKYGLVSLVAMILATLVISWLSFRLLESPFLRMKKFFEYGAAKRPGAGMPAPIPSVSNIIANP